MRNTDHGLAAEKWIQGSSRTWKPMPIIPSTSTQAKLSPWLHPKPHGACDTLSALQQYVKLKHQPHAQSALSQLCRPSPFSGQLSPVPPHSVRRRPSRFILHTPGSGPLPANEKTTDQCQKNDHLSFPRQGGSAGCTHTGCTKQGLLGLFA